MKEQQKDLSKKQDKCNNEKLLYRKPILNTVKLFADEVLSSCPTVNTCAVGSLNVS